MKFSALEKAILDWIAQNESDEKLIRQIENSTPAKRKHTPVGLWLDVRLPTGIETVSNSEEGDVDVVLGPVVKISNDNCAESALYVTDGYFDTLEIFNVPGEVLQETRDFVLVSK